MDPPWPACIAQVGVSTYTAKGRMALLDAFCVQCCVMMEAIVLMCLASAPELCREVLVPFSGDCAEAEAPLLDGLVAAEVRCVPAQTGYPVTEVAPGVFVFTGAVDEVRPSNAGAISNAGFVVGQESVAVVDTLGSRLAGEQLYRAVRATTDKPISHVILTHMHPDHIYGATVFAEAGAQVVGHQNLARALADRAGAYGEAMERLMGPEVFLGSALPVVDAMPSELNLGGRVLELRSHGFAHTATDVTVLDKATGTMFTGDLVFDRHTPALDGSVVGWQEVLAGLKAKRIVPGHGAAILPWPEGGADTLRYLGVLARDARAAIAAGESISTAVDHIGETERGRWELFDMFNPRNATAAFAELEWE